MNKSITITANIIRVTGVVGLDGFLIGLLLFEHSQRALSFVKADAFLVAEAMVGVVTICDIPAMLVEVEVVDDLEV